MRGRARWPATDAGCGGNKKRDSKVSARRPWDAAASVTRRGLTRALWTAPAHVATEPMWPGLRRAWWTCL